MCFDSEAQRAGYGAALIVEAKFRHLNAGRVKVRAVLRQRAQTEVSPPRLPMVDSNDSKAALRKSRRTQLLGKQMNMEISTKTISLRPLQRPRRV